MKKIAQLVPIIMTKKSFSLQDIEWEYTVSRRHKNVHKLNHILSLQCMPPLHRICINNWREYNGFTITSWHESWYSDAELCRRLHNLLYCWRSKCEDCTGEMVLPLFTCSNLNEIINSINDTVCRQLVTYVHETHFFTFSTFSYILEWILSFTGFWGLYMVIFHLSGIKRFQC